MMRALAKVGFIAVLHVLHLEERALGAARVRRRAAARWRDVLPAQLLRQHAGHPHEYLQHGGPPAFDARLVLAATLGPSYGIYSGFEHYENVPVRPGSEEYLDSEKYEVRDRALDGPLLAIDPAPQRAAPRAPGAAAPAGRLVPRRRERRADRLRQARGRRHRAGRRQRGPAQRAGGRLRDPPRARPAPGLPRPDALTGDAFDWRVGPQLRAPRARRRQAHVLTLA